MRKMPFLVTLAAVVASLLVACGDDDSPGASGPALSDHDYLKVVCSGLTSFSNALLTKTKPEDLAQVIKDYVASLKEVNPPADVRKFHDAFIKYLEDSFADPTSLVTKTPPLPAGSVRQRLAAEEARTAECKDAQFFSRPN